LTTVSNVVSITSSIPGMEQRAPRLARLDQAFNEMEQTAADVRQIDETLRASVVDGKNQLTQEAVDTLTGITTRVDTRLADAEAAVDEVQSDIDAFQVEMDETESRLLLYYNLGLVAIVLLMLWLVYSQVVVIRYQWSQLHSGGGTAIEAAPSPEPVAAPPVVAVAESAPAPEVPQENLPREE
jgi:hypothetical protein